MNTANDNRQFDAIARTFARPVLDAQERVERAESAALLSLVRAARKCGWTREQVAETLKGFTAGEVSHAWEVAGK